jgi:hypothetical protein
MKKFILSIAIALLTGSFATGQNYLNENFDGTWSGTPGVPSGWSNIHTTAIPGTPGTGTDPVYWAQNTWSGTAWSSAGASVPTLPAGAYSNSSVAWYKNGTALATQKDQLTTPAINLSASSYSVITFYLACGVNQTLDAYKYSLKIRGFDGSTWSDIQTISKTGTDWTKIMVPVPAVYNVAGAKFGIEITADNKFNIDIWIDDFRIDEVAAPLSGTKTIGVDYASVALAIKALNESGISGPVTINVPGDYTETFVSRHDGLITATGTITNPIIFQKSGGGANPVITAGTGATTTLDGIIKIAGGDYITFDGINLSENSLNTTQTTRMEFGYALLKASNIAPFNGCQNIIIKNCTITMNKATTCTGIYAGNHLPSSAPVIDLTGGNSNDAMNNCQFFSNTVTNVTNGIGLQGWSAPTPYDLYCQNIEIGIGGANIITDFNTNGINPRYMKGLKVANNSISSSTLTPSSLVGIAVQNTTHYDIYSNTITLAPAALNSGITGISVQSGEAGYTSNIYSNIVQNCTNATATSGAFTGITVSSSSGILNFYSNTVNNNSIPGTGGFTGMSVSGGNTDIYNNTVSNNTKTGISGLFTCMALTGTTSNSLHDNFIFSNSNTTTGTTTGGAIYGISCGSGSTLAANIYKNRIYNLNATGANGIVNGIYCSASSAGLNVYNNFISDLRTPTAHSATKVNAIAGIYVNSGTTVNAFYNTVYLNATSTGASLYSAALYASTNPTIDLRNNVFVNVSAPGTGVTAAYRRSAATPLTSYSNNSNANVFYTATTEDATHTTFYDGTTASNFAAYQTLVGPVRDAGSFYELPPFINVATTPYDLHINITPATSCESGGVQVTSPLAITDDFDGNPRLTVPDIGADEFAGLAMGVINPGGLSTTLISSSQIDVAFASNPSTDNVVIVWNNTGVFTTPSGTPPAVNNAFAGGTLLYNGPTATVNHTGLTGATTYYYKAFSYTGSAYSQGVTVSNITNIAAPTALTATTIDNTQIDLAWTKNAFNNDVLIAYNPTNSTFGQPVNGTAYVAGDPITSGGTVIYVGPLSAFNNTGLNGATTYNYKAWSVDALNNNVYSPTGTTASALTWCNPSVLPYSEGFEGGSLGCGSTLDVAADGSTTWAFYYGPSQAHNSTASIRIGTPSMAPSNDWYFTNWLQLTAGVTYELKFWWRNSSTTNLPHQLEIKYGNAPSVAGMSSPAIYSNTNLNINNTWTEVSCTFTPSVSGNIYIGFHNTTPVPPATSPYFYIDDISVTIPPVVDWCNLQWPATGSITVGGAYDVYAQTWEPGVTEAVGQGAGITSWIGYSTSNTDPSTWTDWVPAIYNVDAGNNDEYMANIGTSILIPGTYYYASRFQMTGGVYKYGGYSAPGGGYWDGTTNVSGVLTVAPATKTLNVRVFLEGPYAGSGTMTTTLNPDQIPVSQPYNVAPWNYSGTESVVSMPAGVVDWVLVDLRDAATPETALPATSLTGWPKAMFAKSDGSIVALDGTSQPNIGNPTVTNNLYVVIRHRNHIAVMSASGLTLAGSTYSYDFSTLLTQAYGGAAGYKEIATGVFGMVSGDADGDGKVFPSDYIQWSGKYNLTGYLNSDYDMDSKVFPSDYVKWSSNYNKNNPVSKHLNQLKYSSQVPVSTFN